MKNLDSLTLKFFYEENEHVFNNGVIQKIQMPKRTEILFYIRNNGENKKFYININPKYPHVCFIKDKSDYSVKIPKSPPMFCMQLRKYLEGAKIIKSNLVQYDRILEFHFLCSDEFGIETPIILSIELMGKYSNVILYNSKTGLIIGSAHNVSAEKSSKREIYGGIKYIYPEKQEKSDILKTSYSAFIEKKDNIPKNFYYFSKPYFDFVSKGITDDEKLFYALQNAVFEKEKIKMFWGNDKSFNEIIFDYFSKTVNEDLISTKKTKLLKAVKTKIKGVKLLFENKIDYEKYERYKKSGDLIFQYIYKIDKNSENVEFEGVNIKLNPNLTLAENAQRYYKLYSKLKSAKEIQEKREIEAKKRLLYLEDVLFSIENADKLSVLEEIEEEITEEKPDKTEKPKVETIHFKGFEIYLGKNNKQNDYIIKKLSSPEDIWFHAYDCPSSHCVLKTQNGRVKPTNEVMLFCANLVKQNSPMKNLNKAEIIYTKRKFLKRPPLTPMGYVTYSCEKEIIV